MEITVHTFDRARVWFGLLPSLLLAAFGSGCGGGDPTVQPTTRMPAPSAAIVDPSLCVTPVAGESGSLSYLMVGGSCVNWSQVLGGQVIQAENRAHALSASPTAVDATALMNWAEVAFAQYFPSRRQNQVLSPYIYRFYPETGNYLGVAGTSIYVLGPVAGSDAVPAYVGEIANFACDVLPASCNAAPVAKAGSAQSVVAGTVVTLDGSASSDANGDPLTYGWTLTSRPAGSTAFLSGATSVKPTFIADRAGSYVATLVVSDGKVSSAAVTVTVTSTSPPPLTAEGVYSGKLTGSPYSSDYRIIVLETGEYWSIYGVDSLSVFTIHGFAQGNGVSNNGLFTSSNARDFGAVPALSATVSATYNQTTKTITGNLLYWFGLVGFSGVAFPASFYNYDASPSIAAISGSWLGTVGGTGESVAINVGINGSVTTNSALGCATTGTLTPRASGKNIFNVTLTSGSGCAIKNQIMTGVAIYYKLSNGKTQFITTIISGDRTLGYLVLGDR